MKSEGKIVFEINRSLCKACGICVKMCPTRAIAADREGRPAMTDEDKCVMCMMCEMRCPDFAIRIGRESDE